MLRAATFLLMATAMVLPAHAQDLSGNRHSDECGAICLYIALRSLDIEISGPQEVIERVGPPPEGGFSLDQLAETAAAYGMQTRTVETSADNLMRRPGRFACIAHYGEGHFVNLIDAEQGLVHVIDAPRSMRVPTETFDMFWSRKALLISAQPIIAEEDLPVEWSWWPFIYAAVAVCAVAIGVWLRKRRRSTANQLSTATEKP